MLSLTLSATDDEPAVKLQLEHSLVSLSKWESLHEKAFFGREPMTHELTTSYIEQMLITSNPPENWVDRLTPQQYNEVIEHIDAKQTATWFREEQNPRGPKEVITNELIYYWMITFAIPFEPCQNWHLNRLMTLIKIAGIKQTKPTKMSKKAQAEEYRRLNAQRRKELGTSG